MEDEIAAVFNLIDRVLVVKPAVLLFLQIQRKTEAGTVDPALADLTQAPYSPRIGQGLCDFGQVCGLADDSETVSLLCKVDGSLLAWQATYSWPLRMICAANGG